MRVTLPLVAVAAVTVVLLAPSGPGADDAPAAAPRLPGTASHPPAVGSVAPSSAALPQDERAHCGWGDWFASLIHQKPCKHHRPGPVHGR